MKDYNLLIFLLLNLNSFNHAILPLGSKIVVKLIFNITKTTSNSTLTFVFKNGKRRFNFQRKTEYIISVTFLIQVIRFNAVRLF